MNRLKFLLFAVVALGLFGYHLVFSPAASLRVAEQGASTVTGAGPAVALKIEGQRSEAQAAIMRVAASPAAWNVGPKTAKPEAPGVDRFASVRPVVVDGMGEASKASVVIGVFNEQGALIAQGSGEPAAPPEGFELATISQAGAGGALAAFNGTTFIFFSTPMLVSDKNEVRTQGGVLVGVPLLPDAKQLEVLARELHLSTLALLSGGKVVLAAGVEKVQADSASKTLKAGQVLPLVAGSVRSVGPLDLPLFVDNPPHSLGARQAIAGTPFEVLAVTSTREPLEALASFQLFGVGGLLGLLLLSVAVALLIKSGDDDEGGGMAVPPPMPLPPPKKEKEPELPAPAADAHPRGPEASPDDFHFPPSSVASSPSSFAISGPSAINPLPPPVATGQTGQAPAFTPTGQTGQAQAFAPSGQTGQSPAFAPQSGGVTAASLFDDGDPFASAAPPPAAVASSPPVRASAPVPAPPARPVSKPAVTAVPPAAANPFGDDEPNERTVAYPAYKPPASAVAASQPGSAPSADPFAMAASQLSPEQQGQFDDNPDATRVAAVPQELIKAARSGASGNTGERPSLKLASMPKVQSVVAPSGDAAEEKHFQDVFRDFVATREKCGEAADGLTFEKFKTKLLKNKEQLVSKYQCRTVRFQVYVKEGKAALKATPVKD